METEKFKVTHYSNGTYKTWFCCSVCFAKMKENQKECRCKRRKGGQVYGL